MKLAGFVSGVLESFVADGLKLAVMAALALVLPYWARLTDRWSWPIVLGAAVLLFAAILSIYRNWPWSRANRAELSLRIHADARQPAKISAKNIGRWYLLANKGLTPGAPAPVVLNTFLFVTFRPWINVGTISVEGRNMVLPRYTTPNVESDGAIICFDGALPAGELEIKLE